MHNTHFYEIADNLSYEGFQKLSELDLEYLVHLTPEIEAKTDYTSKDDTRLKRLYLRLDSATKRGKPGMR